MSKTKPYVKVTAAFYLKNAPEGHLGLRQENWNFGMEPVSLDELIFAFVRHLTGFYVTVMPDSLEDVNAAIKQAGEAIAELRWEEKGDDED